MRPKRAAEALYGALQALELAARGGRETFEISRRLGALFRWNNDGSTALVAHEALLARLAPDDPRRGLVLAEMAWDRIQWVAWDRRYDHPWVAQARQEAEQAFGLADGAVERLIAAQALLMTEALTPPGDQARLDAALQLVRQWHDQIPGASGLWDHLIGNDVVKPFVPEATTIALPTTPRSPEVLDVTIHASPPAQDLLRTWNFDGEEVGRLPREFSATVLGDKQAGAWRIEQVPDAPTAPNVLTQTSACAAPDCMHLLLADAVTFEYPDLTVHLSIISGGTPGGAGLVLAARDPQTFYAVIVNGAINMMEIYRVVQGRPTLLGSAPVRPNKEWWHLLRVQGINTGHVNKFAVAAFFGGRLALEVTDEMSASWPTGQVGLVTRGDVVAKFDRFQALQLLSNKPLSKPAPY